MNADQIAYVLGNARREGDSHSWCSPLADKHNNGGAASHLLDVRQAAGRLVVSPTWPYRRADRLPFTRQLGGHLHFDAARLQGWLTHRTGGAGAP